MVLSYAAARRNVFTTNNEVEAAFTNAAVGLSYEFGERREAEYSPGAGVTTTSISMMIRSREFWISTLTKGHVM